MAQKQFIFEAGAYMRLRRNQK